MTIQTVTLLLKPGLTQGEATNEAMKGRPYLKTVNYNKETGVTVITFDDTAPAPIPQPVAEQRLITLKDLQDYFATLDTRTFFDNLPKP